MSKIAVIRVNLVPEASEASHNQIEKEIAESLQCDWLLTTEKVTVANRRLRKKLEDHGYTPETIHKILELYTKR